MAKYSVEDASFTNIADAIRDKKCIEDLMTPAQMVDWITSIDDFYTENVIITDITTDASKQLLSNNAFCKKHMTNPTFFVVIFGLQVTPVPDSMTFGNYQWYTACNCATPVLTSTDGNTLQYGFGAGAYMLFDASNLTPRALAINSPFGTEVTSGNSHFHFDADGNVYMHMASGNYLGPGGYKILLGILMTMEELAAQQAATS